MSLSIVLKRRMVVKLVGSGAVPELPGTFRFSVMNLRRLLHGCSLYPISPQPWASRQLALKRMREGKSDRRFLACQKVMTGVTRCQKQEAREPRKMAESK
jgi:hypothetical protein